MAPKTAAPASRARAKPAPASAARLDVAILSVATALLIVGVVMNLSASSVPSVARTGSAFSLFVRQLIGAALGFVALFATSRLDYRKLRNWTYAGPLGAWVLLMVTLHPGVGAAAGGATRWIRMGPVSIQPSEAAKLALLLFGADMLSRKQGMLHDWRHLAPFLAVVAITCGLVLMQPDFGTMLIIGLIGFVLAFLAGTPGSFLLKLVGVALLGGLPIMLMEGYRRDRFFGFLNCEKTMLGACWQSTQGLVALGTGRFFGMGLGSSRQKWFYLPNAHTDFIFAIIGEETGLAGTLTVLVLFGTLAVLGIRAARRAPDSFGFLLAAGATAWISLQVLINAGAVTSVLPITGVPLPFISFGGSSLIFSLSAVGLIASVARQGMRMPRPVAEPSTLRSVD